MKAFFITLIAVIITLSSSEIVKSEPAIPLELQKYQWRCCTTPSFEIYSIDWQQSEQIQARVEALKSWTYRRWGMADLPLVHKCMIICVPSNEIYKQWFHSSNVDPKRAKSRNSDESERDVYGIWICGEGSYLTSDLPEKIARVCFLNYEDKFNLKMEQWASVGMSALNNDVNTIRSMLQSLDVNGVYTSQPIFTKKLAGVHSGIDVDYRARAAALCLMLRKQQDGGNKYGQYLMSLQNKEFIDPVGVLNKFGFQSYEHFDISYSSFTRNLVFDIRNNRTPDIGLTWFVPKEEVLK